MNDHSFYFVTYMSIKFRSGKCPFKNLSRFLVQRSNNVFFAFFAFFADFAERFCVQLIDLSDFDYDHRAFINKFHIVLLIHVKIDYQIELHLINIVFTENIERFYIEYSIKELSIIKFL